MADERRKQLTRMYEEAKRNKKDRWKPYEKDFINIRLLRLDKWHTVKKA